MTSHFIEKMLKMAVVRPNLWLFVVELSQTNQLELLTVLEFLFHTFCRRLSPYLSILSCQYEQVLLFYQLHYIWKTRHSCNLPCDISLDIEGTTLAAVHYSINEDFLYPRPGKWNYDITKKTGMLFQCVWLFHICIFKQFFLTFKNQN